MTDQQRPRRTDAEARSEALASFYRQAGMVPPWLRAWFAGVDVTAEPLSTWPPLYRDAARGRYGRVVAERYAAAHAEAVAEREG